nr:hypothetical protein GCM10025732_38060 [Glycomyces mayteni]
MGPFEGAGLVEGDAADGGGCDGVEQVEEQDGGLVDAGRGDAVEFGEQDRAGFVAGEAGHGEGAHRGAVEELDGSGEGVGAALAFALEGGDLVGECGVVPGCVGAGGLGRGDEVGGGFGDDGVPGGGEVPGGGGLPGAGGAGEDVAAQGVSSGQAMDL